ncbi:MAG: hypothetical protein ACRDSH_19570, partial [Pseudonocardiaceae bacterium]
TREWTTEQGDRRSVVELEATAVGPDLARCAATVRKPRHEDRPRPGEEDGSLVAAPEGAPETSDEADPPGGVNLTDLAEAARPLVPVPA